MLKLISFRIFIFVTLTSYCCLGEELQVVEGAQDCGNAMVDLVLVIDSSGSVESVFEAYRDAARDLSSMLPIGPDRTLITVIAYNGEIYEKLDFTDTQNVQIINKTLSELEWLGGPTQSADAVDLGISAYEIGRQAASKMFVLMTDGNSMNTWKRVQETAARLYKTGARIYVVALGDSMYEPELEEYAGPNGTIVKRNDFNKFKGEILDLTGFVCHPAKNPVAHFQVGGPPPGYRPPATAPPTPSTVQTPAPAPAPGPPAPGYGPPAEAPTPGYFAPTTIASTAAPTPETPPVTGYGQLADVTTLAAQSPTAPAPAPTPTPEAAQATKPAPTLLSVQDCAADILFILDSSGSVRNDFDTQIRFMLDLIDGLTIDLSAHLVAVVEYAGEMRQRLQFSFTAYLNKNDLTTAIRNLPFFSGTTATGEALKLGKHALGDRRKSVPAIVFVLTDGFSQDDVVQPAADLRSEPNTELYAVGVTHSVNVKELLNIAGDSSHVFVEGNSTKIKTGVLPKFITCGSPRTSISESTTQPPTTVGATAPPPPPSTLAPPTNPPPPPSTEVPTTVPPPSTSPPPPPTTSSPTTPSPNPTTTPLATTPSPSPPSTAVPTTLAPTTPVPTTVAPTTVPTTAAPTTAAPTTPIPTTPAPIPTTTPIATTLPPTTILETTIPPTTPAPTTEFISKGCLVDLAFVLDSSGSVAQTFQRELEFAASIVDRLIVGPQNARIAAIKYAGTGKARVVFPFNKYNTKDDVKKAIQATSFISGTTATNEALQLTLQEYDPSKGARPGEARFIAVVFTDGFSQDDPGSGAKALQAKGATVYAIGVNAAYPVNRAELIEIAGDESRVFTDETIDSLYNALDQLEQACKDAGAGAGSGRNGSNPPPATPSPYSPTILGSPGPPAYGTEAPPRRYPPNLFSNRKL